MHAQGDVHALSVLLAAHPHALAPSLLNLLRALPETLDPREYQHLLPRADGTLPSFTMPAVATPAAPPPHAAPPKGGPPLFGMPPKAGAGASSGTAAPPYVPPPPRQPDWVETDGTVCWERH